MSKFKSISDKELVRLLKRAQVHFLTYERHWELFDPDSYYMGVAQRDTKRVEELLIELKELEEDG